MGSEKKFKGGNIMTFSQYFKTRAAANAWAAFVKAALADANLSATLTVTVAASDLFVDLYKVSAKFPKQVPFHVALSLMAAV
jgi:hypothetical protein